MTGTGHGDCIFGMPVEVNSEGFHLMTRIQDEVHRFAIEYHRSLRSKAQVKSVLDDIPGIGPARRKALMRYFKALEKIRDASVEELMKAESMNEKAARNVYEFFHQKPETEKPETKESEGKLERK